MNFLNQLAINYRNSRAILMAVMLFAAIGAMQWLRCNPMVGREPISARVLSIEAEQIQPHGTGGMQCRVVVITADSVKVELLLPQPVPQVGDNIPLMVEEYKSGDKSYYLDFQKWMMDGPS
ncbi:MAG: hypothetical protein GY780_17230 [bacterium]|nr:hypothetical protein [bacterium]